MRQEDEREKRANTTACAYDPATGALNSLQSPLGPSLQGTNYNAGSVVTAYTYDDNVTVNQIITAY